MMYVKDVEIVNCTFTRNSAETGGAISIIGENILIENTIIKYNYAYTQ